MLFSFIFPIYNEELFLESQIEKFIGLALQKYKNKFEIILVENGSEDRSWSIAKKIKKKFSFVKIYKLPFPSYGQALKTGLANAAGKKIFFFNVDYFNLDFIEKATKLLNTVDIVIGSKTLANSSDERSFFRKITTYMFNVFLRLILNYPGTDTHGIKAFKKTKELIHFAKICRTQNELFDTELVIRLTRNGAIFVDLPQKISELRKSRYFGMRRIKSTIDDLILIIKTKYFFGSNFYPLLVDADDFGMSDKVNSEIINQVDSNSLNIVSIMPNLVKKRDLDNLKMFSETISYSMHLNLLRGLPCEKRERVSSLVNGNGVFYSLPFFSFRLLFGLISLDEVKLEFMAQYRKLRTMGIVPKHLNSEQHIHVFSPINNLLENEIKKTSIKKIRSVESSFYSLSTKPFRRFCLFFLKKMFDLKFDKFNDFKDRYDAYIVHPGA
jgi:predicted glycoside hydrolase/deacetylase ChbG (UPF0249 family)